MLATNPYKDLYSEWNYRQDGNQFPDDIFKIIFLKEKYEFD